MNNSASPLHPQEIGALVGLINQNRSSEAEGRVRQLLVRHPDAGMLWKILGVALVRQGKDAMAALRRTTELMPGDSEAHRNLAAACHARGQWAEALVSLHQALAIQPHDADGFAEAADAMRALGRAREAVPLYERALLLNPQLVEAQNNLGNAFLEQRRNLDAARCYRLALEARPEEPLILCNLGNAQRLLGLFEEAKICLERAIALNNTLGIAYSYLGQVLRDLGRRRDAVTAFERAIAVDSSSAENHCNLGTVLFEMRRVDVAMDCYRQALALKSDYAPAHLSLGLALRQQRRPADAEASCRAALVIDPNYVEALAFLGELQADRGKFSEAEELFVKAIAIDPEFFSAFASIATHRKMTLADTDWLRGAQSLLGERLPLTGQISLSYALGKYFDDVQKFDDAFRHYARANELTKRYGATFDRSRFSAQVTRIIERFQPEFIRECQAEASAADLPIFIVGMPRSGTSLTEQILASHPAVFGAGELKFWHGAYRRLEQVGFGSGVTKQLLPEIARNYLERLNGIGNGASRVVDKMPANFLYAGLIHAVFPNARIIHMQRHPMDTCLSIYFQNFFNIGPYANDLDNLAHYYREYLRVTDHWRATLPAMALLEVPYEALIDDQEGWTRRVLDFIGLPWDPQCLNFQDTNRVIITASKWQVRQKIHRASTGRWKNYEKFLGPLQRLVQEPMSPSVSHASKIRQPSQQ